MSRPYAKGKSQEQEQVDLEAPSRSAPPALENSVAMSTLPTPAPEVIALLEGDEAVADSETAAVDAPLAVAPPPPAPPASDLSSATAASGAPDPGVEAQQTTEEEVVDEAAIFAECQRLYRATKGVEETDAYVDSLRQRAVADARYAPVAEKCSSWVKGKRAAAAPAAAAPTGDSSKAPAAKATPAVAEKPGVADRAVAAVYGDPTPDRAVGADSVALGRRADELLAADPGLNGLLTAARAMLASEIDSWDVVVASLFRSADAEPNTYLRIQRYRQAAEAEDLPVVVGMLDRLSERIEQGVVKEAKSEKAVGPDGMEPPGPAQPFDEAAAQAHMDKMVAEYQHQTIVLDLDGKILEFEISVPYRMPTGIEGVEKPNDWMGTGLEPGKGRRDALMAEGHSETFAFAEQGRATPTQGRDALQEAAQDSLGSDPAFKADVERLVEESNGDEETLHASLKALIEKRYWKKLGVDCSGFIINVLNTSQMYEDLQIGDSEATDESRLLVGGRGRNICAAGTDITSAPATWRAMDVMQSSGHVALLRDVHRGSGEGEWIVHAVESWTPNPRKSGPAATEYHYFTDGDPDWEPKPSKRDPTVMEARPNWRGGSQEQYTGVFRIPPTVEASR